MEIIMSTLHYIYIRSYTNARNRRTSGGGSGLVLKQKYHPCKTVHCTIVYALYNTLSLKHCSHVEIYIFSKPQFTSCMNRVRNLRLLL